MTGPGLQRRKIEVLLDAAEQIPALPSVAAHLLRLLVAGRPSRRDIQLAIEIDPALSARTLQLALELGCPPDARTSINDIMNAVPIEMLAGSLLSLAIADKEIVERAHLVRLWRHAIATAMASQVIATRLGTMAPEAALLAGMLHDIGRIALPVLMPRSYAQVLERVEAGDKDLLEAEREVLGLDHAVFGKRLAQRWDFPPPIQSVIWLHHQAQVPQTESAATVALVQVVRLADLLVRQEGVGYHPSEPVRENTAELAERLGLSSAHAEQIGRQVADAFERNTPPVRLDAEPSAEELLGVLAAANARLGRLCREGAARAARSDGQARQAALLIRLNHALASCHSAREVLDAVAAAARDTLNLRIVVPYIMARTGEYVEGIRASAAAGTEEHFLYDVAGNGGLEPPPPSTDVAQPPSAVKNLVICTAEGGCATFAATAAPARAERLEGWLFDRQGPRLGQGPFYTAAMMVENRKVGGIVFAMAQGAAEIAATQAADIAALANMAGVALKRIQAESDLVASCEELAEVNRELEAAHRERLERRNVSSMSEMAAGAAHEINNPLAIISGRAQQLETEEQDPARKEHLHKIIQQASRISDIIAELRLFAQPPAPHPVTVGPASIADQAAAEVRPEITGAAVQLRVEAPPDAVALHVDPGQVAGALKELLRNAVQACTRAGRGTVTLAVETLEGEQAVRFVVADDGPGMDPQVRARAFDPFYSGYDAGRRRGLGLPKAYRAVQASGGRITLESTPGRGTIVRVTFSAAGPQAADQAGAT